MKIISYYYQPSEKVKINVDSEALDSYRKDGWSIVNEYAGDDGVVLLYKPSELFLKLELDDGTIKVKAAKRLIMNIFKMRRFSKEAGERFVNAINAGEYSLEFSSYGDLVCFKN